MIPELHPLPEPTEAPQIKEPPVYPVRPKDTMPFRCTKCANCCRHVRESIMITPYDGWRLARLLNQRGEPLADLTEFYEKYCDPILVTDIFYPFFMLKVTGAEDACIFLKNGRCSVYGARPNPCELYPFTADWDGQAFHYYYCLDKADHTKGGKVRVGAWFNRHFSQGQREYMQEEYKSLPAISRLLRKIPKERHKEVVLALIFHYFSGYDFSKPFLPQYRSKLQRTTLALQKLLERTDEEDTR